MGNPYRPDIKEFNDIVIFFMYNCYSTENLDKIKKESQNIQSVSKTTKYDIFSLEENPDTIIENAKSKEIKKLLENIFEKPSESIKVLLFAL